MHIKHMELAKFVFSFHFDCLHSILQDGIFQDGSKYILVNNKETIGQILTKKLLRVYS